jgi:hypothetical protein
VALKLDSFSLTVERELFFDFIILADSLLFDSFNKFDKLLFFIDTLEPLPLKLPSPLVVVGVAGILFPIS